MKTLAISADLRLPIDAATQTFAFVSVIYHELVIRPAQSSSGKIAVAPRLTSKRSAARRTINRK